MHKHSENLQTAVRRGEMKPGSLLGGYDTPTKCLIDFERVGLWALLAGNAGVYLGDSFSEQNLGMLRLVAAFWRPCG